MALQNAPDQISHSDIMAEFGHPANTEWKLSSDGSGYISFAVGSIIKESDFYGQSSGSVIEDFSGTRFSGLRGARESITISSKKWTDTTNASFLSKIPLSIPTEPGDSGNKLICVTTGTNAAPNRFTLTSLNLLLGNTSGFIKNWVTMTQKTPDSITTDGSIGLNKLQFWWAEVPAESHEIHDAEFTCSNNITANGGGTVTLQYPFAFSAGKYKAGIANSDMYVAAYQSEQVPTRPFNFSIPVTANAPASMLGYTRFEEASGIVPHTFSGFPSSGDNFTALDGGNFSSSHYIGGTPTTSNVTVTYNSVGAIEYGGAGVWYIPE